MCPLVCLPHCGSRFVVCETDISCRLQSINLHRLASNFEMISLKNVLERILDISTIIFNMNVLRPK